MNFQRQVVNHIHVHVLPTKQFKTFSISLIAHTPLEEDTVTETALIPYVLRRGTAKIPETIQLREELDYLYGAGFGFNTNNKGLTQSLKFSMDIINDRFVNSEQSLLSAGIHYLGDIVTSPLIENGHFRTDYVEAEKQTVKKQLDSIINDKMRYAAQRCVEEMFVNEPIRLNSLGKSEDLAKITPESLYKRYQAWLQTSRFDFYVVGDTSLEEVVKEVQHAFKLEKNTETVIQLYQPKANVAEPKTVVDQLEVNQGKLNLGLKLPVSYRDESIAAALLYNGILGSYPHSKLFINVREKASLAYYCASSFDPYKGYLSIQSGIEFDNYKKALDIIEEQLKAMENGLITEDELKQTKALLINAFNETFDSAFDIINFDFVGIYFNTPIDIEQLIAKIEATTIDEIVSVAKQVNLQVIYFLRNKGVQN